MTRRAEQAGFTLIELLVVVATIVILTALVAPSFGNASRARLLAASAVLGSDIEFAQVLTITHPDRPVVVRFDPAHATYWLAEAATPDTPILHEETGEPLLVTFGEGRGLGAEGVTMALIDLPDDTLTFAAHGGLEDLTTAPIIKLMEDLNWIKISVGTTTGAWEATSS